MTLHVMLFIVSTGPMQQNGLDPAKSEIQKLQNRIQQLEYNVKAMATVSLAMVYAASATFVAAQSGIVSCFIWTVISNLCIQLKLKLQSRQLLHFVILCVSWPFYEWMMIFICLIKSSNNRLVNQSVDTEHFNCRLFSVNNQMKKENVWIPAFFKLAVIINWVFWVF